MSSYFNELNNKRFTKVWYYLLQGFILIFLGLALFFLPLKTAELVLILAFILLLIDGSTGIYQIIRKKANHRLFHQIAAKSILTLAVALIIFFRPVVAIELLLIGIAFLMFFRSLLISLSLRKSGEISISKRVFMIFSLVISIIVALVALISLINPTGLVILFMSAFLILEGIEDLLYARLYVVNVEKADQYLKGDMKTKFEVTQKDRSGAWIMIDSNQYTNALVVAPHPDDLEGFCGGMVFSMNNPVTSVVMAGGNKGVWEEKYEKMVEKSKESYIKVRLDESKEAGNILGVSNIIYMGYLDRGVEYNDKSVKSIVEIINEIKPDLIISFEYRKWATLYPHPDHIATARTVRDAVETSRKNAMNFDYLLASTLLPNRFIDVTSIRKIKLSALAVHTTQTDLNSIIFPIFEKFLTRLWGLFTNSKFVEGYREVLPNKDSSNN